MNENILDWSDECSSMNADVYFSSECNSKQSTLCSEWNTILKGQKKHTKNIICSETLASTALAENVFTYGLRCFVSIQPIVNRLKPPS